MEPRPTRPNEFRIWLAEAGAKDCDATRRAFALGLSAREYRQNAEVYNRKRGR